MKTTKETLEWYSDHNTKSKLGFDPDGMCLKVCRTARGIASMFPSALSAQLATPRKYRVSDLNDIRAGMVVYFDDPIDDNPFGHIVTVDSRSPVVNSLSDLVVWTNSVKSNSLVRVRGDYFQNNWGDEFQFAATWLNGEELDLPPKRPILAGDRGPRLRGAIRDINAMIKTHSNKPGHERLVRALKRDLQELKQTLAKFEKPGR